jgi:hypothetical protein
MRRVNLKRIPLRTPDRFAQVHPKLDQLLLGLYLAAFCLLCDAIWQPESSLGRAHWADAFLILAALASTLTTLSRQLPGQNVLLAFAIVVLLSGAAEFLNRTLQLPFGPRSTNGGVERQLVWAVPMIWAVAILNARGAVRLAMRPWRQNRYYGFWVLGFTALLVVWMAFSLEPFSTTVRQYWSWEPTRMRSSWYGTPWVNFLGWLAVSLLVLAFATPTLINKSPAPRPPQYQPLIIWLSLNLLLLVGAASRKLWFPAMLAAIQIFVVGCFAALGERRKARPGNAKADTLTGNQARIQD